MLREWHNKKCYLGITRVGAWTAGKNDDSKWHADWYI